MKIFIPSYLNNCEKRKTAHLKQLEHFTSNSSVSQVIVLAQDYATDNFFSHEKVTYINVNKMNVSSARNLCLAIFYASNDEFCLIVDNDVTLSSHHNFYDIIKNTVFATNVATIQCNLSFLHETTVDVKFIKDANFISSAVFYRNLPKHNIKPVYYDHTMTHTEDVDYGFRLVEAKLDNFLATFIEIQHDDTLPSTIVDDKTDRLAKWREITANYFVPKYNAKVITSGVLEGCAYARYE